MSRNVAFEALSRSLQNKPTQEQANAVFKEVFSSQKKLSEKLYSSVPSEKDRHKVYTL